MPTYEHIVATVNAYVEGFACKNPHAVADLFADNASVEDPVGSALVRGKAAINEFYTRAMGADMTLVLEGPVRTVADYAAFAFSIHLTDPKGHRQIDVIDLFRFDTQGKIVEMRAFWGPQNSYQVDVHPTQ